MRGFLKKGAMFGLDARIALAVLAIVALSIGLTEEKQVVKTKQEQTDFQLEFFKANFLKHWSKIRKEGYLYDSINYNPSSVDNISYNGYTFRRRESEINSTYYNRYIGYLYTYYFYAGQQSPKPGFTHPDTSKSFSSNLFKAKVDLTSELKQDTYIPVINMSNSANYHHNVLAHDITSKLLMAISNIHRDVGSAKMPNYLNQTSNSIFFNNTEYLSSGVDGYGNPMGLYFLSENDKSSYSLKNNLLHVVAFSLGENGQLESTLPTDLVQLRAFSPAGDDKFIVFSDLDIYADMTLESNRRLEEIRKRILSYAENSYIDRISLCSSQSVVTADCDLDSDGDYDNKDENLILDLNPFPKEATNNDGTYLDPTNRIDLSVAGSGYKFMSYLGLPEYYAVDLFGNRVSYDSNVGDRTKGPFTMEVGY